MQDHVDAFEEIFIRLAAIISEIAENFQIAMLMASFGDKNQSAFGHTIASLQTLLEKLDWEPATAMLRKEHDDQLLRSGRTGKFTKSGDSATALQLVAGRATEVKDKIAGRGVRHTSMKSADAMLAVNSVILLEIPKQGMANTYGLFRRRFGC